MSDIPEKGNDRVGVSGRHEKIDTEVSGLLDNAETQTTALAKIGEMPEGKYENIKKLLPMIPVNVKETYEITRDQMVSLERILTGLKKNLHGGVPMVCTGDACPYYESCELKHGDITHPIGSFCIPELWMVHVLTEGFIEELNIDPEKLWERVMLKELIEDEIIRWRTTRDLSISGYIVEDFVGFDANDNPIFKKDVSPSIKVRHILQSHAMKIKEAFMATRQQQAKHVSREVEDLATAIASHQEKLENENDEIEDAEIVEDKSEVVNEQISKSP